VLMTLLTMWLHCTQSYSALWTSNEHFFFLS
jgi:hypothetical protein